MQLCEGDPWGPWMKGIFTPCFSQLTFMSAFAVFILLGGIYRLIVLLNRSGFNKPLRKIHWVKLACCAILLLSHCGSIGYKIYHANWYWYQLYATIRDLICWALVTFIICLEFKLGTKHSKILRAWWVMYYIGIIVVLQALRVGDSDQYHGYDRIDATVRFATAAILVVLGLFVKEGVEEEERQRLIEKQRVFGTLSLLEVEGTRNPYEAANFFSKFFLVWPGSIVALGYKRPLDFADLWHLTKEDTAETCVAKLEQNWAEQLRKPNPSLFRAFWAVHGRMFILSGLGKLTQDISVMSAPIILYFIIKYLEDKDATVLMGLVWVAAIALVLLCQSLGANLCSFTVTRIANQVRAATTGIVYRKAVRVSSAGKSQFTAGEIQNYQSVDANRIAVLIPLYHLAWSAPLQIIIALTMMSRFLGIATLAGAGVALFMIPLSSFASGRMLRYQKGLVVFRDKRIRIISEMLSGIRLIKFFNWENFFAERVLTVRETEINQQKKSSYAGAVMFFFVNNAPLLVALATFTTYVLLGNQLNPQITFTALSFIYTLRVPIGFIPMMIGGIVESKLSINRIQRFLMAEDMDTTSIEKVPLPDRDVIQVINASFKWSKEAQADTLSEINFTVKKGELVAVVGTVGSGKSSLMSALLGEMHKTGGRVLLNGSVAYVPQQAWMQNATLRANILFGKQFVEAKYRHCIDCCELMPDIHILPNRDMTEIGEKGINLSGGQKQRISLARAMYQNADIYLFDSPLSAVDAHVGSAIFENMILGGLSNTARIFVTHQLDILNRVDKIIVMHDGKIAEMGTYPELMAAGKCFAELVQKHVVDQDQAHAKAEEQESEAPQKKKANGASASAGAKASDGKLIEQEERKEGAISWRVYQTYLKSAGYGAAATTLFLFVIEAITAFAADGWLAIWANSPNPASYYKFVYLGIGAAIFMLTMCRALMYVHTTITAARTLHNTLLSRIIRVPMSFFDTTPIGRVINRFSRDQASVDAVLPTALSPALNTGLACVAIITVISVVTPYFLVPLLPIAYMMYFLHQYYMSSLREMQRLDSISRSPIYALFSETLNGIATIRSYEMLPAFIFDNDYKIDRNMKALFVVNGIARWFAIRLELICNCIVTLAALFCILQKDTIPPSLAGLSISYAMTLIGTLSYLIKQSVDVETNIISVERIVEYQNLPLEGSHEVSEVSTSSSWPEYGGIEIKNLKVRYREGLDLVLSGVNASIKPHEKIGIVGRTGAGKSSLFLALFRMVEAYKGTIIIDGINIAKIGLAILRSRLAIIPQDPVLFTGTIRSNLDPFDNFQDTEIWDVLEGIQLKSAIEKMPNKLDSLVVENGDNFSVGQRQLFCLGRALLRKAKILLMDEATASVDIETDALIQKTIREKCKDVTVLTIAHRINTILDSDRVMVLDKGQVIEFDTPTNLSSNPNSIFYSLLQESRKNSSQGQ
eukprot:Phypoly_transcript_00615.p1 GENE.Phypoly_transcript_00615~~Phypoly_transcript_00615.p1  ORF type:complete len:1444 (+),score=207.64 Phypoly_transcript_00615:19-4350(+)